MNPVVKVLEPSGILDGNNGNQLRRDISDIVGADADIVLVDLQNVTFMDSSGLGAIISACKTVRASGSKFYVCSINDQVRMLFQLTKMERVLTLFANREAFNQTILGTEQEINF